MSIKIQIGNTIIITPTSIPKGLIASDSTILPSKSKVIALVVPHDGQGIPVTFLIIHTRKDSFS